MALADLLKRDAGRIVDLEAAVARLTAENEKLTADLQTQVEAAVTASNDAKTSRDAFSALAKRVTEAGLKIDSIPESVGELIESEASKRLAAMSAARGIRQPVPEEGAEAAVPLNYDAALKHLRTLHGKERSDFYRANRRLLYGR